MWFRYIFFSALLIFPIFPGMFSQSAEVLKQEAQSVDGMLGQINIEKLRPQLQDWQRAFQWYPPLL